MGMKPGVKRWWPEVILFVFSLADVEKTLILQVVLGNFRSGGEGSVRFTREGRKRKRTAIHRKAFIMCACS